MIFDAIQVEDVSYSYGERKALDGLSLSVRRGEIFGLLGPNGGGKTTLFRILTTLFPLTVGRVTVLGLDLQRQPFEVRKKVGVVFQSPSVDKKLTVRENLKHQGHLYGLSGLLLESRIRERLQQVGLSDRWKDLVETLSGGLQRRVELAKAFLHEPEVLLLDEPTTGLDPGARKDLWDFLKQLREQRGVTIGVTTHLMEEAERCDQVAILDEGRLVALDRPEQLRLRVGGEVVMIQAPLNEDFQRRFKKDFDLDGVYLDGVLRVEHPRGHDLIPKIMEKYSGEIQSVSVGKPSLEDVFIKLTGHRFWDDRRGESSTDTAERHSRGSRLKQ